MNISLTPHYEELVKSCVDSGRYNNVSEVMREALRLWEQHRNRDEWLRNEAIKGHEDVLAGRTVRVSSEEEFLALARGNQQ
jgi:putative addiction module CopG family antidote